MATLSVEQALGRWRARPVDLTRRNPLRSLPSTATLVISLPGFGSVLQRLVVDRKPWRFWNPPIDEDAPKTSGKASAWDLERHQPQKDELVCGDLGRRRLR